MKKNVAFATGGSNPADLSFEKASVESVQINEKILDLLLIEKTISGVWPMKAFSMNTKTFLKTKIGKVKTVSISNATQ